MDDNINIEETAPCTDVEKTDKPAGTSPTDSEQIDVESAVDSDTSIIEDMKDVVDAPAPCVHEINPKDKEIPEPQSKKNGLSFVKDIYDFVEVFVFAVCSVMLVFTFLIRICVVSGPSMENTLYDGEVLLVSNLFYEPDYGDIVIFHQTSESFSKYNELIVKRVIAKGGDVVDIDFDTWTLTVNGEVVEEDYITLKGLYTLRSDHDYPLTVPEGHLFLMGDNRNHSADSRSDDIGFVDERRILGRVVLRVTPISKLGVVE